MQEHSTTFRITGQLVDIPGRAIYPAVISVENGRIAGIRPLEATETSLPFIIPGFVDSHVHIESSMLVPSEFAKLAVVHGTVGTVSDPHEIANVCGMGGVAYMIDNGKTVPFKFAFGAHSCVPATNFETAGATLGIAEVTRLLEQPEVKYLSEMMNFPGVLQEDPEVLQKIKAARDLGKPVDGHAPGLQGEDAQKYIAAGISTDHECFTRAEALTKLQMGMKILIREGSAAKNFEALIDLLQDYPEQMMFCSDDKHPDSLVAGHINQLCARAVARGIDPFNVLQAACINPVLHYQLDIGWLRPGDAADFAVVKDLHHFDVLQTYINGQLVAEKGESRIRPQQAGIINQFDCSVKQASDFAVPAGTAGKIPVIEALDGQLITNHLTATPKLMEGQIVSDVERDILKIAVVNRYQQSSVATAFIKNFGLREGALASSVAHDSHNIVVVGVDDETICRAVNLIIEQQGGISAVSGPLADGADGEQVVLAMPVAGLMSNEEGYRVAAAYTRIDQMAKTMGSTLSAPFMTLSFMALLVIPALKLSDQGLFDAKHFRFVGPTSEQNARLE